jgi:hypothetical protein
VNHHDAQLMKMTSYYYAFAAEEQKQMLLGKPPVEINVV